MSSPLLIVIATYNEVDALPILIKRLLAELPATNILVIDDNSPDGTGQWCDQAAQQLLQLRVIHRAGKLGLGTATKLGLQEGLAGSFDLIATMDADLSHDPATLAEMVRLLDSDSSQNWGAIIGSRYVAGGAIHGWPWYRLVSSYVVNQYARIVLGLTTRDNTSAMRVYRTSALQKLDLDSLRSPGYAYLEEILVLMKRQGIPVSEHPIIFKNRETGASKVGLAELASSLWEILKLSFR